MIVTLPILQVKEFLKLASYVEVDEFLIEQTPEYGHIKIEVIMGTCFLTKVNLNKFAVYSFETESDDCRMIVLEDDLKSFITTSKRDSVRIDDGEKNVSFYDGYNNPKFGKIERADVKNFPKTVKLPKEFIRIEKDVINSLDISKNYIGDDKLRPFVLYAHIKEDVVFATDAHVTILNKLERKVSDKLISLSKTDIQFISNFDYIEFYFNENFSIFKNGNCVYGSRFYENISDVTNTIKMFSSNIDKTKYFKILLSDFKNFCESTVAYTKRVEREKKNYKSSSVSVIGKDKIRFVYDDAENSIENNLPIDAKIVDVSIGYEFKFAQKRIKEALDNMPTCKEVCISESKDGSSFAFWVQNEDGTVNERFIVISMKMQA